MHLYLYHKANMFINIKYQLTSIKLHNYAFKQITYLSQMWQCKMRQIVHVKTLLRLDKVWCPDCICRWWWLHPVSRYPAASKGTHKMNLKLKINTKDYKPFFLISPKVRWNNTQIILVKHKTSQCHNKTQTEVVIDATQWPVHGPAKLNSKRIIRSIY